MTKTKVADIIVPTVFNPYVTVRSMELSALYRAGIISNDPALDTLATSGGKIITMPFFNDLTGDDEVLSDDGSLSVDKITTGSDAAVLHMRGKAWSSNDLAKALSGADPMAAIGDLVAGFWARKMQALTIATMNGVFADNAANDSGDMVNDISLDVAADITSSNLISAEAVMDTAQTMGDAKEYLTAIAMHSTVQTRLAKQDLIDTIRDSEGNIIKYTYLGLTVIVDDGCPAVAVGTGSGYHYTSYLFGAGALGLGNGAAPVPTETDRDSLAGDDVLINRKHFLLHPRGIKWLDASVAGKSPTNSECAAAANWNRVYDRKLIRMAKLVTNG